LIAALRLTTAVAAALATRLDQLRFATSMART
jgi:hypothetical protein